MPQVDACGGEIVEREERLPHGCELRDVPDHVAESVRIDTFCRSVEKEPKRCRKPEDRGARPSRAEIWSESSRLRSSTRRSRRTTGRLSSQYHLRARAAQASRAPSDADGGGSGGGSGTRPIASRSRRQRPPRKPAPWW